MDAQLKDRRVGCPYCGETLTIVLDLSAGSQSYVEDCQVCCQPMQVSFSAEDGELENLRVERAS
jgi:transcription elongation factor Elf1